MLWLLWKLSWVYHTIQDKLQFILRRKNMNAVEEVGGQYIRPINSKVMKNCAWAMSILIGILIVLKIQHADVGDNVLVIGLIGIFSFVSVCWFVCFSSGMGIRRAVNRHLIGVSLGGIPYWGYAYFFLGIKISF